MTRTRIFEKFARGMEQRRPGDAALLRLCALDPAVMDLVPEEPDWDVPHRLLAAVQLLVLRGLVPDFRAHAEPWLALRASLHEHRAWISQFVHRQGTQTNEPQRCFALLPIFLTLARDSGKPLDLIELGTSGGLNLFWDRHRYRYRDGVWGAVGAELALTGDEAAGAGVPATLLSQPAEVRRRRGIDLNPVDVRSDDGLQLLEAFLLGDPVRADRLHKAAAAVRREPPELIRGNYVDVLPDLLVEHDPEVLTVVFQTISTLYLPLELRHRLTTIVRTAGAARPMAWISTPTPEEHGERRGNHPIELTVWPGGARRTVARMSNHGDWLEWAG